MFDTDNYVVGHMELASPLMVGGVAPVKKMCIPVLVRSGQEFVDSVPDTPVKKGMHIFFTLRLVPSVSTQGGCDDLDGPGHAPL